MILNDFISDDIEIIKISNLWSDSLAIFFKAISESNDERFFHPHPLTIAFAHKISAYNGKDLYYAMVKGREIIGYGMLRGWDEGYIVPSLAIAIHPDHRHKGLGEFFVSFLHLAARSRGVDTIRLKVYENNTIALNFYNKIGYIFSEKEENQLVGFFNLEQAK